jgi:hypothetical protein
MTGTGLPTLQPALDTEALAPSSAAAPAHWECDVVLVDGGTVHVRPLLPEDADRLMVFHQGLSDETVFMRFFSASQR